LLERSTKVSRSHEHFPVFFLPKSAIHKIEIIAITPNFRKAFQDGTAVVRSSVRQRYSGSTDEVQWKYRTVHN